MGYIIASAFNCMVVMIFGDLSVTFFPHSEPPPDDGIHRLVAFAYVRDNHFVRVKLKDGAPDCGILIWCQSMEVQRMSKSKKTRNSHQKKMR